IREIFNQDLKIEAHSYERLIRIAKTNLHRDTTRLIIRKKGGLPLDEGKENVSSDCLGTLSDALCQLTISSTPYQPTPFETANVYIPMARAYAKVQSPPQASMEQKRILRNILL
ncbi:MAG TPA: hypothetical protein PLD88_12190, partial [Candidatus Berkiella sp.]|nr:hypothetical protein [Candidatus Berkiella sp.]